MLSAKKLLIANLARKLRPQDVFATSLYPGGTTPRDLITGLDMAGKGGLFWGKAREQAGDYVHALIDTVRGADKRLASNLTDAENTGGTLQFLQSGVRFTGTNNPNSPSTSFVGWSFRRAKKFFDIITYTGNGVAGRKIAHDLGVKPGMIVVKRRDAAANWPVYHVGCNAQNKMYLNTQEAKSQDLDMWNNTEPTEKEFSVGSNAEINASGGTYVAYVFAHNPDLIQCVRFLSDGSGNATINHGWSNGAQFLMFRPDENSGLSWEMYDTGRSPGWSTDRRLKPNTGDAEDTVTRLSGTGATLSLTNLPVALAYCSALLIRSPT